MRFRELPLICLCVLISAGTTVGQEAMPSEELLPIDVPTLEEIPLPAETIPEINHNGKLRFSFSGAPWREVLDWLSEAGELSLYVDDVPEGSFTYTDDEFYSISSAIERLNLFLLPRGYTLVQRGRLLAVINLGDPRSLQQLDSLAQSTTPDKLEDFDPSDIVKCFIPLDELIANDVLEELQPLSLMKPPVVLAKSNQLMMIESVQKMREALQVVTAMKSPSEVEQVLRRFDLEHIDADTVLLVAGKHLGIPEDELIGLDITITSDLEGKRLFALGSEEKVARLDRLIELIDVPEQTEKPAENRVLVSHSVSGANLQIVYDVLQTMLADQPIRLSIQESTQSVVALAPVEVHQQIESTIKELEAPPVEFAVVELGDVDPYFAVSLVSEMFAPEVVDDRRRKESEDETVQPPKVDADPGNRRLFVRGTKSQVAQVQQVVEKLKGRVETSTAGVRVIPLTGPRRDELLRAARNYWRGENPLLISPGSSTQPSVIEKSIHDEPADDPQPVVPQSTLEAMPTDLTRQSSKDSHFVAERSPAAPIRGQVVPEGIIVQSDDPEALARFEKYMQELKKLDKRATSPPVIYYLKFVSAEMAVKMLVDLLDGGVALQDAPAESLVRGANPGDTYFSGSYLIDRNGVTTVTSGTATIVSDARLNRLIVQGTNDDVAMIDQYMKIIDKETSITGIETSGKSNVIQLRHTVASSVAEMIRAAFPNRVHEDARKALAARNSQGSSNDRSSSNSKSKDTKKPEIDDKPTRDSEPKMAIAVHERSNSLVITAPKALFDEVEQLVQSIDQRSERAIKVIAPSPGINVDMINRVLAEQAKPRTTNQRSR